MLARSARSNSSRPVFLGVRCFLAGIAVLTFASAVLQSASGAELKFKERALADLVKQVPGILKSYDPKSGHFGSGIWICNDQQAMYPLAAAYATAGAGNPYHKDAKLLDVIMTAGDALIQDMNADGQWMFRKKDGSTWGYIHMPWTYSRWIRTYQLIQNDMPPEPRQRWSEALTLGYGKIARSALGHVHNIPSHHAMGLYAAGKALQQPEWCQRAADFLMRVMAKQSEGGYWSEGVGPVVLYDLVYVEALGTYYAMSGDRRVLPALEKAAIFHRQFTYPNGENVETIDQRNPYHSGLAQGNVGFTMTPTGRAYLAHQWSRSKRAWDADLAASLVLFGQEGPLAEPPQGQRDEVFVLREGGSARAATVRRGPWFVCLSAYTAPIPRSRWVQDRQNLVSVYHEKTGLILGGGNTKLQPAWSNFAVGDLGALAHRPGDTNPDFLPKRTLYHVPSKATLAGSSEPSLDLTYGPETCRLQIAAKDDRTLEYVISSTVTSDLPVHAHVTLLPRLGKPLETGAGQKVTLGKNELQLAAAQLGGWVAHAGCRLHVPATATLLWPVLPHNPYRADGRAAPAEGRIAVRIPLDREHRQYRLRLEILGSD